LLSDRFNFPGYLALKDLCVAAITEGEERELCCQESSIAAIDEAFFEGQKLTV